MEQQDVYYKRRAGLTGTQGDVISGFGLSVPGIAFLVLGYELGVIPLALGLFKLFVAVWGRRNPVVTFHPRFVAVRATPLVSERLARYDAIERVHRASKTLDLHLANEQVVIPLWMLEPTQVQRVCDRIDRERQREGDDATRRAFASQRGGRRSAGKRQRRQPKRQRRPKKRR